MVITRSPILACALTLRLLGTSTILFTFIFFYKTTYCVAVRLFHILVDLLHDSALQLLLFVRIVGLYQEYINTLVFI